MLKDEGTVGSVCGDPPPHPSPSPPPTPPLHSVRDIKGTSILRDKDNHENVNFLYISLSVCIN